MTTVQIKVTLEQDIAREIEKEAKAIGVTLPVYIKILCGQHVQRRKEKS